MVYFTIVMRQNQIREVMVKISDSRKHSFSEGSHTFPTSLKLSRDLVLYSYVQRTGKIKERRYLTTRKYYFLLQKKRKIKVACSKSKQTAKKSSAIGSRSAQIGNGRERGRRQQRKITRFFTGTEITYTVLPSLQTVHK